MYEVLQDIFNIRTIELIQ